VIIEIGTMTRVPKHSLKGNKILESIDVNVRGQKIKEEKYE